jgi:transposase
MFIKTNRSKSSSGKINESKLLCESYWENGKSKTRTIISLKKLPIKMQLLIEQSLASKKTKVNLEDICIEKTIDYGYFMVIYEIIKRLKIDRSLEKFMGKGENTQIALLMIIGKIITKDSKLAIVNWILRNEIIAQKLEINLKGLNEKKLYAVLADLDNLQLKIEQQWYKYHQNKTDEVHLYDITNFYFEGVQNELAEYVNIKKNKSGKKGKKVVSVGLITNKDGFPLSIKTFKGNISDCKAVQSELLKLKNEYAASNIILVGDRGMRIRFNLEEMTAEEREGITYISGLTLNEIRKLEKEEVIQPSFFDKDLVEIEHQGKRLVLCTNPILQIEQEQKREGMKRRFEEILADTQRKHLSQITKCENNKNKLKQGHKNKSLKIELTDKEVKSWNFRVMKALEKYNLNKAYQIVITKEEFTLQYNPMAYENLGKYDGKYVFESNVSKDRLSKEEIRDTYRKLQNVEHAFRNMKITQLCMRPINHVRAEQTRGHMFVGMFALTVITEMENQLFPWLAELKEKTKEKTKLAFKDAIEELKMIKLSVLSFGDNVKHEKVLCSKLNDTQKKILRLLGINEKIFT